MKPTITEIFKVPLYSVELNLDIKNLELFCKEHQHKDLGRIATNDGGYQSNSLPINDINISPLIKEIQTNANIFADEFILRSNITQEITNIWININSYRDSNILHNHPGCDISGAYYIKTPTNSGDIILQHPGADVLSFYMGAMNAAAGQKNEIEKHNTYNIRLYRAKAIENTLYLFPSYLKHYVESNKNKTEERISISFNIKGE